MGAGQTCLQGEQVTCPPKKMAKHILQLRNSSSDMKIRMENPKTRRPVLATVSCNLLGPGPPDELGCGHAWECGTV